MSPILLLAIARAPRLVATARLCPRHHEILPFGRGACWTPGTSKNILLALSRCHTLKYRFKTPLKPSRRWTPILCTDHLVITCLLCAPSLGSVGSCIFLCYAIIFDMTTRAIDLSPTADTKAHVVAIWEDKPHFACAQCSAVVVSNLTFVSPCVCFTT